MCFYFVTRCRLNAQSPNNRQRKYSVSFIYYNLIDHIVLLFNLKISLNLKKNVYLSNYSFTSLLDRVLRVI